MKSGLIAAVLGSLMVGCAGQPTLFPNSDPNLNRTSAQFAADAAKRHPYHADAPRGGDALATAQYDLTFGNVQLLNYGDEDWNNVELWLNKKYVCYLPKIEKGKERVKVVYFTMLFDDSGTSFTTDGGKSPIQTVEVYRNGRLYTVPFKLLD